MIRIIDPASGRQWDERKILIAAPPSNPRRGMFGMTRNGGRKRHNGLDLYRPHGLPVWCFMDGEVFMAGEQVGKSGKAEDKGYGLRVYVQHQDDVQTIYAHLGHIGVSVDQKVRGRHILGLSGDTGNATGELDHVHFAVRVAGRFVDPIKFARKVLTNG